MTMQYGAVKYVPSSPNGNWTQLCQVAAQARSVGYGATRPASDGKEYPNHDFLRKLWRGQVVVPNIGTLYNNTQTTYPSTFMNKPASYMTGTKYFNSASSWYPSLEGSSASSNSDFLTNYFMSAMQTFTGSSGTPPVPEFSTALSGTNQVSANVQIFEKSSTYFVATTHLMYYLELAEKALTNSDTAGAKNHFDSIAALYFGCGDTNPVPLPIYTPDTVWTTAPQEDTQITWTADKTQKSGDGGTVYSMYNLANKRASNYGNCGPLKTGSCSSSKTAQTTTGSVTVADLNIVVADALNYGTTGPTSAGVSTIRDSINTINAQAAQRYIARISLDANLPGNGMGGSTKLATVNLPAGTTAGAVPTACGGGGYVRPGAPAGDTTPIASERVTALLANNAGTNDVAAANIGKNIAVVAPTTYVAPSGTGGVVAGTFINAPCGTGAGLGTGGSSTGTAESNTATMETVMNVVSQAAAATAPYVVQGTLVTGGNDVTGGQRASSNTAITAATRGEAAYVAGSDYSKKTPTGCIGPDVYFDNPVAVIQNTKKMVYTFCNPDGYKGVARSDFTLANNINLYTLPAGTQVNGVDTYAKTVFGGATKDMTTITNGDADTQEGVNVRHVWDPVMAAQLTDGGFCCAALYYGPDGTGRAQPYFAAAGAAVNTITGQSAATVRPTGTGLLSGFVPPLSGGDMTSAVSPGTMCPAHGSGNGKTAKTVANIGLDNPALKELLEGQAFYAALAPSQYDIPTTSTTAATQTANAKKQRMCAEQITDMMKLSKVAANTPGTGAAGTISTFANSYSAVEFPLWKVAVGASDSPVYTVPSGYCYANACFDDFAKVGTQSTFKGTQKLGELVSGPNMAVIDATPTACGRANVACATPPATWNGGPAVMNKLGCTATTCTAAGILNTTGAIPVA